MPYLICYSDTFQIVRFFRRDKTQILLQKFKKKISDRQGSILCRVLLNTTVSAEGYSATTPTLESVGQPVNEELLWVLHAKKIRYCNGKFITIIHIGILCSLTRYYSICRRLFCYHLHIGRCFSTSEQRAALGTPCEENKVPN